MRIMARAHRRYMRPGNEAEAGSYFVKEAGGEISRMTAAHLHRATEMAS